MNKRPLPEVFDSLGLSTETFLQLFAALGINLCDCQVVTHGADQMMVCLVHENICYAAEFSHNCLSALTLSHDVRFANGGNIRLRLYKYCTPDSFDLRGVEAKLHAPVAWLLYALKVKRLQIDKAEVLTAHERLECDSVMAERLAELRSQLHSLFDVAGSLEIGEGREYSTRILFQLLT